MNKYSEAAILAVQLLKGGSIADPPDAWVQATQKYFPTSTSLQNKGCPKGAFLGLCNKGMIEGLPPGKYSNPTKNGKYATDAIEILRKNRFLSSQPDLLWKKVAGKTKSENHQMDVVVGLWEANCISA
jgi:hypothetical protein